MSWTAVLLVVYGIINVLGGIMGYVSAGSIWSLVVGAAAGLLLVWSGLVTRTKPALGFRSSGLFILALIGFWVYRIVEVNQQGKSPMMAVMNLVLGVAVLATLLIAHFAAVRKRKASTGP